jgi:Zn-dependent protease
MFDSLKLGKLFGIDVHIHGTFWLLPLFVLLGGASAGLESAVFETAVILAIFGCVALHEVGHALAARMFGIGTRDITLYPVGGIARLERMPERPFQEVVIALAGPAVNVVIAVGLFTLMVADGLLGPGAVSVDTHLGLLAGKFIARLAEANLFLAVFNLLPAFPMDGGRVLRALLATVTNRVSATRMAVTVGGVLAAGLFVLAVMASPPQPMLMLLAAMVFLLGRSELAHVRAQEEERAWRSRAGGWYDPSAWAAPPGPRAGVYSGWEFDPVRRVWTEWQNGHRVREVREV